MIVAGFATQQALERAVAAMRPERLCVETYTPCEMEKAGADSTVSPLPLVMAAAGVAAGVGMFLLQSYADVFAYPVNVGGRPDFSWPAFIVNAFEVGVLCAMLTGLFGCFVLNRMPALYDPVDECDGMREASRDGWFLAVRGGEPGRVRALLDRFDPTTLQELAE